MSFNYDRLKGQIIWKYGSLSRFADALGISSNSLSNKINNKRCFTSVEILKCIELLSIDQRDVADYFFATEVQPR